MGDLNWAKTSPTSSLVRSERHSGAQWDQEQRQGVSREGQAGQERQKAGKEKVRPEGGTSMDSQCGENRTKRPRSAIDPAKSVLEFPQKPQIDSAKIKIAITTGKICFAFMLFYHPPS
ncbi:hypothetical protein PUN28_015137 [Cardiocondyla obscurior]|uniref:Uncharacterized protein n=1 Tax=Cardiocondyla obscurior TaxID=286306 RepID=A0AAW2F127_9HYME